MGYDIWIDSIDVVIPPAKHADALAALNAAGQAGTHWLHGKESDYTSLEDVLIDRFQLSFTDYGSEPATPGTLTWDGDWFRDYHLDTFWEALAPYIDDGGTIDFEGEDGQHWRYFFRDGKRHDIGSTIVYDDPPGAVSNPAWLPADREDAYYLGVTDTLALLQDRSVLSAQQYLWAYAAIRARRAKEAPVGSKPETE
jgi:hypothetical protein